jgi:hypothetical protein
MNVLSLIAKIGVDSTEFDRSMKKVGREGESFAARFGGKFGSRFAGFAGLAIAGVIASAFIKLKSELDEVITKTDEVEDRMRRFGQTVNASMRQSAEQAKELGEASKALMPSGGWANFQRKKAEESFWARAIAKINAAFVFGGSAGGKQAAGDVMRALTEVYGGADKQAELGRQQYLIARAAREADLLKDIDEQRLDNMLKLMTEQERMVEFKKVETALEEKLAGFRGRKEQRLQLELNLERLREQMAAIVTKKEPAEKGLRWGMTRGAGGLAEIGGLGPFADWAGIKTINAQMLTELRKITLNTDKRGGIRYV